MKPGLRLAIDVGPLLLFFIINMKFGLMAGTAVLMVATLVALGISYGMERRIAPMPVIGCAFVMLFGVLALLVSTNFMKIEPTIFYMFLAVILTVGVRLGRNPLRIMMNEMLVLREPGWRTLSLRYAAFFVVLALLNEIVWRTQTQDFWVSFKVFGFLPLTLLFSAAQIPLILRHQPAETPPS